MNFNVLNKLPGAIGYKDINSVYIGGNVLLAKHMGYQCVEDIIGCTDFDIKTELASLANTFRENDKFVLNMGKQQTIDTGIYPDGKFKIHLSTKQILVNEADVVEGLVFYRVELDTIFTKKIYQKVNLSQKPNSYSLGGKFESEKLTTRESETLFYLIRGYTAKEIALVLNISAKTIDYYIEQLKVKFEVRKRSELIEKTIEQGFLFNIPRSIL